MSVNSNLKTAIKFIVFIILLLVYAVHSPAEQSVQGTVLNTAEVNKIISLLEKSTQRQDFAWLKSYIPRGKKIIWDACGPSDTGSLQLSFNEAAMKLRDMSRNADIYVFHNVDTYLWNSADKISILHIQTEGWNDEFPYLNFLFKFMHNANKLEWYGVCYDNLPPRIDGQYEIVYKRPPVLPRKGPRTFKNLRNLMVRIEEIMKFKAFDALAPYAVNSELVLGECSPDMMGTSQISGKNVSARTAIDFLIKNDRQSKSAIVMVGSREMYLDTIGWAGNYPNVSFWFRHSADGWHLSGVSYCKTSLFEMMFPNKE